MIYFIQDGSYIKIGYAKYSAEERLRSLQIGNPRPLTLVGTMLGDVEDELDLHAKFPDERVRGEWFKASDSLLGFIKANAMPLATKTGRQSLEYKQRRMVEYRQNQLARRNAPTSKPLRGHSWIEELRGKFANGVKI